MNIGKGIDTAGAWLKKSFSSVDVSDMSAIKKKLAGETIMEVNNPINAISGMSHAKGFMGGIQASYNNIATNKMGVMDGIKAAHMKADGSYNLGAIAGSYIGVSAAARIAGGGGAYKDRGGRTNVIGVPFV